MLDARSKNRFDELHIKGAISLPFTDMSIDSLKKTLPDKNVTILIYSNNNFRGNLPEVPIKARASALNLSTFYVALQLWLPKYLRAWSCRRCLQDETDVSWNTRTPLRLAIKRFPPRK